MTLKVCVKGDRYQAARAMADAGIPFAFQKENSPYRETYGLVGDQFEEQVRQLFHKHDHVRDDGCPLPIGTVLLWSKVSL